MAKTDNSAKKTFITVKEKRKFNWLVLALLFIIVVIGAASLWQGL